MRRISTSDLIYARVLLDEDPPFEETRRMHRIFQSEPMLVSILENPTIPLCQKYSAIDKVFDKSVCNFLKVTVKNNMIYDIRAIYNAYKEMYFEKQNIKLVYITEARYLNANQLKSIEEFVKKRFNTEKVELEIREDKSLIGGFIINVDDCEIDRSIKGKLENLRKNLIKTN